MRNLPTGLVLLFLSSACMKEPVAVPAPPAAVNAPAPAADDCTLATPLVPGIPGSPGHLIASARNPNGDSELAVLMRRFVDDLQQARPLLEAKKPVPKLLPAHRRMRCSWPTKPEERNEKFDGLAIAYLATVKAYDDAPGQATYNGILAGCVACHSQSCGGPLDFIDSMKWQ
ncbi:MAG: hypothetical protein Q7T30_03285 [Planctomycetota bacterium]|nr:hypothetical protein [Planctomycetota bacterium]